MYLLKEQIRKCLEHCPKDEGVKIIEDFLRKIHPYLDSVDVKDLYDDEYRKMLANHPIAFVVKGRYPIHIYAESTFRYLKNKLQTSDNVLEIGCDCGNLLLALLESTAGTGGRFIGLDFNENSIAEAVCKAQKAGKDNCEFVCCDANNFKSKVKFDYIILNDVIEHLSDKEMKKLMRSCRKMLNTGGEIVMHTPNGLNECCQTDRTVLSALYFYLFNKMTGYKLEKNSRQLYYEQVHINVKSYRQWKCFFRDCGYTLDVRYDKEIVGGIFPMNIMNAIRAKLQLNCNMLLIAKRM